MENEEKIDMKEKILLSIIISITGFFVLYGLYGLSIFIIGSTPKKYKESITMKYIILIIIGSLFWSMPISLFVLLLFNINYDFTLNLLNYLKCFVSIFVLAFIFLIIIERS
jgi:hypothetical protein